MRPFVRQIRRRLLTDQRTLCWFSAGAASAIATRMTLVRLPDAIPVYCETGSEHTDNERFMRDCEKWWGRDIVRLKSDQYSDTWDVWEHRKYVAGIKGAPCTGELKVKPRVAYERADDIHVFGYTADSSDKKRAVSMGEHWPHLDTRFPLIDAKLNKAACLALLIGAGIEPPLTYALGYLMPTAFPAQKPQVRRTGR